MKRFKIQAADGHTLLLYYRTQAEAQERWPDAIIQEYDDQPHVEYIQRMMSLVRSVRTVEQKGSTVYIMQLDTPAGICFVQLFQDIEDGVWYDVCKYQLWKTGAVVVPACWTLSNPADFCKRFLFADVTYTVLSSGKGIHKPKELCGIRKFASVVFGKCSCQLFLKDGDLYINHHDYFSPLWRPPEDDLGQPQNYYLRKYFGESTKPEKFIYADNWGSIVLQNKAWLRITSFLPMIEILNAPQVAQKVWGMIREYHNWPSYERNTDWERFLEDVVRATQEYLNREVVGEQDNEEE